MPEVKNEKGEVIANMPYNQAGQQQAQAMVAENPGYTINDASQRNVQTYAGGGKTGYNVPMYKEGGKTRMKDEDMVLDMKNREKVKSYEDRFKDKKETQAPSVGVSKKRPKKPRPKIGAKPSNRRKGSSLKESLKKAKEYEKYKPRKYKDGGEVTKRDVKKLTKVKVSMKDARDEDVQKAYGTEGRPWKTRRAIKKQAKKKRKRMMGLAKEGKVKRSKKNPDQINYYDPDRKQYASKVKKSKISGKK